MKSILLTAALTFATIGSVMAQTYFLQEDFEGGMPGAWTQTTLATDGGFLAGTGTALSSTSFTIPNHTNIVATNDDGCNCNKSADRLITSSIDLSGASSTVIAEFDLFYFNGSYQGAQEIGRFEYSVNGGNTWTELVQLGGAGEWQDGLLVDISALAGNSDVLLSWLYNDGAGWTFGMGLDNVSVYEPTAVEVELTALSIPEYAGPGASDITGTITSFGASTLNDVSVSWTDGTNNYSENLTGLGLEFGETYDFTHADQLTGVAGTTYNLTVSVMTTGDANATNNEMSTDLTVGTQLGTRLSLVEDYTSSTCPPCQWLNVNGYGGGGLNAGLTALNGNEQTGAQVSVVKYPVDWPGNGDHAWNNEVETRRGYYGVTGAPTPFVDGSEYSFNTFNGADVAAHQAKVAVFDIAATHTIDGTDITVSVEVDPYVAASARLYIALVEKVYDATSASSFSNGETEFHHIMRKMLPNANGTSVSLTPGTQYTTTQSFSASVMDINSFDLTQSVAAGNVYDFHTGAEVEVVVWLQRSDKVVLNSTVSVGGSVWGPNGITEYADNTTIGVYPNPATSDDLNVRIHTEVNADALITITDVKGAIVLSENLGNLIVGDNQKTVNISNLSDGLYNVNVFSNGHVNSTKVIVR